MSSIKEILSVKCLAESENYVVSLVANIGDGDETISYALTSSDVYGIAPLVRNAVSEWIDAGNTPEEYVEPVSVAPDDADVNRERDRRIDAGFVFNGVHYQSRQEDRENISGAYSLALAAVIAGASEGDFRWHGGSSDFVWIAADDSRIPMDAQTVMAFGSAALEHKRAHIFAGSELKTLDPIPEGFTDDIYWP